MCAVIFYYKHLLCLSTPCRCHAWILHQAQAVAKRCQLLPFREHPLARVGGFLLLFFPLFVAHACTCKDRVCKHAWAVMTNYACQQPVNNCATLS